MFRRCHRLKKSHINIPDSLRQTSMGKLAQMPIAEKQNITINYAYSNIKLTRSFEISKSQTLVPSNKCIPQRYDVADKPTKIDQVKSLCGQIQTLNQKIQMYKDILAAKESRHSRNKAARMQEKEKLLEKLIQQYQFQREQNQLLMKQLGLALGHKNSFSMDRRTTATFQYFADS